MTSPSNAPEPPDRDGDGAQAFVLGLTVVVAVPLVSMTFAAKGLGAAIAMGFMIVLAWLYLAGLIPQRWDAGAAGPKAGPIERVIVLVVGIIGLVICAGLLTPSRDVAWDSPDGPADSRGVMEGARPTTAERILDDVLRKN